MISVGDCSYYLRNKLYLLLRLPNPGLVETVGGTFGANDLYSFRNGDLFGELIFVGDNIIYLCLGLD